MNVLCYNITLLACIKGSLGSGTEILNIRAHGQLCAAVPFAQRCALADFYVCELLKGRQKLRCLSIHPALLSDLGERAGRDIRLGISSLTLLGCLCLKEGSNL